MNKSFRVAKRAQEALNVDNSQDKPKKPKTSTKTAKKTTKKAITKNK
jgi:hypothetical protein